MNVLISTRTPIFHSKCILWYRQNKPPGVAKSLFYGENTYRCYSILMFEYDLNSCLWRHHWRRFSWAFCNFTFYFSVGSDIDFLSMQEYDEKYYNNKQWQKKKSKHSTVSFFPQSKVVSREKQSEREREKEKERKRERVSEWVNEKRELFRHTLHFVAISQSLTH